MRTLPKGPELLDAVSEFLHSNDRHSSFLCQVAANALGIVRREWEMRGRSDEEAAARLASVLGHAGERDVLERQLAEAIADGSASLDTPGVRDHLWATVLAELAIDQPRYPTYLRVMHERHTP